MVIKDFLGVLKCFEKYGFLYLNSETNEAEWVDFSFSFVNDYAMHAHLVQGKTSDCLLCNQDGDTCGEPKSIPNSSVLCGFNISSIKYIIFCWDN